MGDVVFFKSKDIPVQTIARETDVRIVEMATQFYIKMGLANMSHEDALIVTHVLLRQLISDIPVMSRTRVIAQFVRVAESFIEDNTPIGY